MRPDGSAWRSLVKVGAFVVALVLPAPSQARFDNCLLDEGEFQWAITAIDEAVCGTAATCNKPFRIGTTVGKMTKAASTRSPELKDCMLLIDTIYQKIMDQTGQLPAYQTAFIAGTASKAPLTPSLSALLGELEVVAVAAADRKAESEEGQGTDKVDAKALVGGWELIDDDTHKSQIWIIDFAADGSFVTTFGFQTWEGTWELDDGVLLLKYDDKVDDWAFAFTDLAREQFKISFEDLWYLFGRRE